MATSFNALKSESVSPTTGNPDPIQLHMRAVNMLNRCKVLIMADEPMYTFALQDLEAAQQAIAALRSLDLSTEG